MSSCILRKENPESTHVMHDQASVKTVKWGAMHTIKICSQCGCSIEQPVEKPRPKFQPEISSYVHEVSSISGHDIAKSVARSRVA